MFLNFEAKVTASGTMLGVLFVEEGMGCHPGWALGPSVCQ